MGKVYLVGAGCGAIDAYTLKAIECIKKADCLIYDHLIDHKILSYCSDHCEKIYVGKKAHLHVMKQDEINQLLVKKANQYQTVVRLKGGDVYVFGRGGEEGLILYEHHIDFEVVPGVSSVTAGLAYAGIPITHRGLSRGFQVYTGQLKYHQQSHFDFSKMLDDDCTYVFLMSMAKIDDIIEGFLKSKKDKETPVAIISQVSLPQQKCLVGTLENIQAKFKQNPLPTPGMIIVGKVVQMRQYLNFFEKKTLFSQKILVTTIGHDEVLEHHLRDLGADVDVIMTGEIEYKNIAIPPFHGFYIFTSQHSVIGFMKNFLKQYKDVRVLSNVKIICIGQKTNSILNQYGLNADYIPQKSDSHYINQEYSELVKDHDVYLFQGENESLVHIHNHAISVYKNKETIIDNIHKHYRYGLFTCASSVRRFYEKNDSTIDFFVSIGPHTTQAIKDCYGNVEIIEVSQPSKEDMINAIIRREKDVL